ncbi:MAG: amidohydrolase family protein, partial [Alphaproteobacteria bacterium]
GAGVRTIEHGNLIDAEGIKLMAARGAFLVPTLVAYDALRRRGKEYGLSDYSLAKNDIVLAAGLNSLELARAAGVPIGFGSDLLGQLQNDQCREFLIRREAMSAQDIIRSATLVNARILKREGQLGELVAGAFADLLVVDGDPYADIGVFEDGGPRLAAIMKGGRFYKNQLGA